MTPLLRARGWGFRHPTRRAWAVRDLDLEVGAGEVVLVCGASGSGKSTLLHGIAGLLDTDAGDVTGLLEIDAGVRVAYVQQDPNAQVVMPRVGDDIAFGPENLGLPVHEIHLRVRRAMDALDIDVDLARSVDRVSGGQLQRIGIAGVLAMQPSLLLLDEPTSMLDRSGASLVREVIRATSAGGAGVLLVEHRVEHVLDLVDRVVVLAGDGGVLAHGTPGEVFDRDRDRLVEAGVWIPDPPVPAVVCASPGDVAISSQDRRGEAVFRRGSVAAITGPNGSGKTMWALGLAGLTTRWDGRVRVADDIADGVPVEPRRWRSRDYPGRLSMAFQNPEHQFRHDTVRAELADEVLLQRLRLTHVAQAHPFTLSGGEQRRLSVGIALAGTTPAGSPAIVLLDEPTFGLDHAAWCALVEVLADARDGGASIIAVSHDDLLLAHLVTDHHRLEAAS